MRISVDADRCRGHAHCVLMAPDLFDLNDDDDRAQAITGLVPASREQAAARASAACPEGAIARHR